MKQLVYTLLMHLLPSLCDAIVKSYVDMQICTKDVEIERTLTIRNSTVLATLIIIFFSLLNTRELRGK